MDDAVNHGLSSKSSPKRLKDREDATWRACAVLKTGRCYTRQARSRQQLVYQLSQWQYRILNMSDSNIKAALMDAMKQSMRDKNKARLGAVRLALAAIKQIEVDDRIELADDQVIAVLDKMVKQRNESIKQFELANRDELAAVEKDEIAVLREFLPQPLNEEEVNTIVAEAISLNNATTIKDMGKVMNAIRPQLAGRADMGSVSTLIKKLLT